MFKFCLILLLPLSVISTCDPQLCSCQNDICKTCTASFTFHIGDSCRVCPYQCATCSSASRCLSCHQRYYLTKGKCELCPPYCLSCNPSCTKCVTGYALVDQKCLPCASPNALSCQTPEMVLSCQLGFWQNGNSCSPCRQFCLVCSSPSNCLQCRQGFMVLVSFGSYCSPCSQGCKTCSALSCSQCFFNYHLVNGQCISIITNCSAISNCHSCVSSNGTTICYSCFYPYYIENGQCKLGASLLCRNSARGTKYYQCQDQCPSNAYKHKTFSSGVVCMPNPWINNNIQLYINPFDPNINNTFLTPTDTIIFQQSQSFDFKSKIEINLHIQPFYKLDFSFKMIALSVQNIPILLKFLITDTQNMTQTFEFTPTAISSQQFLYFAFSTKNLQGDRINLKILTSNTDIQKPFIGVSQLIVQLYPCPQNCQFCYNAELCYQCAPQLFVTPDYECVSSCNGYLQMYLPYGDFQNYTSKYCVLECPSQFYTFQNKSQYFCMKCQNLCVTCLSKTQCLSCISPYIYYEIDYSCLLSCPNTHYKLGFICTPCNAPCASCLDQSICLSCSIGFYYGGSCLSTCPEGTYENYFNNTCCPCDSRCSACIYTATYCLSCISPFLLNEASCITTCVSTLYYQTNNTCQPCIPPCLDCSSASHCLSCSIGYLSSSNCLTNCISGYFQDSSDATCKICQNGCKTCLSENICLSCPIYTHLYSYSCLDKCPEGTYPQNNICINCLLPCSSCSNQTFCLGCSIGYLSEITIGKCLASCQDGFFGYELNSTCLPCSENCFTCSGFSYSCLSCISDQVLQSSTCLSVCLDGYYNMSGVCLSCSYPCLKCTQNDFKCTGCYSSFILVNQTCISECPSFYFQQDSSCIACQSPCLSCLSLTQCLSCAFSATSQSFLHETKCLTRCHQGTFPDSLSLTCKPCLYPCLNCLSEHACISCLTGYLNPLTKTCQICSAIFFANQTSQQCQLCSSSLSHCQECASFSQCTVCELNYILLNSSCVSLNTCLSNLYYYVDSKMGFCSSCISPCLTCLSESQCTSCLQGYLIAGNCQIVCPFNFFTKNRTCQPCSPPCLTCASSEQCLTCNQSSQAKVFSELNSTCISAAQCPNGSFVDTSLGYSVCISCKIPCSTCVNSSYCLTCAFGLYFMGQCKPFCPNGYFADRSNISFSVCSLCSENCFKCTDSAYYCISCQQSLYLQNHTCVSSCSIGFYLDLAMYQCFACIQPCKTCSGISHCLTCIYDSFILYYGQCLSTCPEGTYAFQGNCLECPSTCLSCTYANSTILCLQCASGSYMSSITFGKCVSICQLTQYGDSRTKNCFSCIAPCVSCSAAISCLSCVSGYLLYGSQCLKIDRCPSGSYLLNQTCTTDCGVLWAQEQSSECISECFPPSLKITNEKSLRCLTSCPVNYRVDYSYNCSKCQGSNCENLLTWQLQSKNIFNILYIKITFSTSLELKNLKNNLINIIFQQAKSSRLLTQGKISFQIAKINKDALWLKLDFNRSLDYTRINVIFNDYYLINPHLQFLQQQMLVIGFDYYNTQEREKGVGFQYFAQIISIILVLMFLVNIGLNSGHLSYSIIDYYQLLFMILFLDIDYPPQLNHFLYGFRYSHYLFLPQIFRNSPEEDYTTATPDKFGVIVPDVEFVNNAGHDFLIIFVSVAILLLCKVIQLISTCARRNKVADQGQGLPEVHKNQQNLQQNHIQANKNEAKKCDCKGWLMAIVQAIVRRFKWNYFNDIIYSIYFSTMLFAFSQLYDLQLKQSSSIVSILLAFLFIILGLVLPFFIAYLLKSNQRKLIQNSLSKEQHQIKTKQLKAAKNKPVLKEDQINVVEGQSADQSSQNDQNSQKKDYQILTDYKCFVSGIKLKVRLGFYHIPLAYFKKLVTAILLVYCSSYPSFVLGVIMMLSIINILIAVALRPFRLTFQQILYPLFDGCYLLIFAVICVMQLQLLNLSIPQKRVAVYLVVVLCVLLSLLLVIHNIIMNILEIIKYFCKIDYLESYYQKQYVSESQISQEEQPTNTPLNKDSIKEEDDQEMFSGLDIYLKKQSTAPLYLLKCAKHQIKTNQISISADKQKLKISQKVEQFRNQSQDIKKQNLSNQKQQDAVEAEKIQFPSGLIPGDNIFPIQQEKQIQVKNQAMNKLIGNIKPLDLQDQEC